jgi:autotransporter-associated beta strand protein
MVVATDSGASGLPLSPALVVNDYLGAGTFYANGITGQNAIVASVEAYHVQNLHEGLGHATVRVTGTGALNVADDHATAVAQVIGWRTAASGSGTAVDPNFRGIAHGADLWSGAIATTAGGGSETGFTATYQSQLSTYRQLLVTGVASAGGQRADVINSSWGDPPGSVDPTGSANGDSSRYIDALLTTTAGAGSAKTVVFPAGNAGPGPNTVGSPAAGYNVIAVAALGRSTDAIPYNAVSAFSSRGPNDVFIPSVAQPVNLTQGTVVPGVRARVDIAAPGEQLFLADNTSTTGYSRAQGTSFAAPAVAGGAALLVSDARTNSFANLAEAIDGRVIKAVLQNSADKTAGWSNGQAFNGSTWTTTQGLDFAVGAGRMNLGQAFAQFHPSATVTAGLAGNAGGTVTVSGWDRGRVTQGTPNDYRLDTPLAAGSSLNVTLGWFADRFVNNTGATVGGVAPDGTAEIAFHDLRLEVWRTNGVGGPLLGSAPVAVSDSRYNTTEHLSFLIPKDGTYLIRVSRADGAAGTVWDFGTPGGPGPSNTTDYGLAWLSRGNLRQPSGNLSISSGTQTYAAGLIAAQPASGSSATVSVSGTGTAVTFTDRLLLGGNDLSAIGQAPAGGLATLYVSSGASVTVFNEVRLFRSAALNVGLGSSPGNFRAGNLILDPGSSLTVTGFAAAGGASTIGFNSLVNSGTVSIEETSVAGIGGAITLNTGSSFLTTRNTTTVTLNSQATVTLAGGGDVRIGGFGTLLVNPPVTGSGNLVKVMTSLGGGPLVLFAPSNYSGSTTVEGRPFRADTTTTLVLRAQGTVGNPTSTQPITVLNNATIQLDNASSGFRANRLPANAPLLLHGGRLTYTAQPGVANVDTVGPVTVSGFSVLSIEPSSTAGTTTVLNLGPLTRQDNGVLFIRSVSGMPIGGGPPGPGRSNISFASGLSPAQIVGANGTGTQTGIIPFAVGNTAGGTVGLPDKTRGLVTVNANGVQVLDPTDPTYFFQATTSFAPDVNNSVSSGMVVLTPGTVTTINSLATLGAAIRTSGTGATLRVSSGVVATYSGVNFDINAAGVGPTLDFGTATGYVYGGNISFGNGSRITGSGGVVFSRLDGTTNNNPEDRVDLSTSGPNTFTGGLTVNGNSWLLFDRDDQLGALGQPITLAGATLYYADPITIPNRTLTLGPAGGTLRFFASSIDQSSFTGQITGPGSLTIQGGGLVALSNPANNYAGGTFIQEGVLRTDAAGALPAGTLVTLGTPNSATAGTLNLNGFSQTVGGLALASGNTGGVNNLVTSTPAATLTVNSAVDSSFGGGIAGAISLVKTGSANLTLTAANTYTGTTAVNAGSLIVSGSTNSATAVGASGTLGGTGSITKAVTVNGTIAPGDAGRIGNLTVNSAVFNSAGHYTWRVNTAPSAGTAGVNWGTLTSTGSLTGSATAASPFVIDVVAAGVVNGFDSSTTQTWTIGTFGSIALTTASFAAVPTGWTGLNSLDGGTFQAVVNGATLQIVFTPVPEPGSVVLVCAVGGGAVGLFRRARSRAQPAPR